MKLASLARRHLLLAALVGLVLAGVASVITYDLVVYRIGCWQTAWREKASNVIEHGGHV